MREDKSRAIQLRRAGKSYQEICEALQMPKSTLSGWFRDADWSKEISKKLVAATKSKRLIRLRQLNATRGEHLVRAYKEARTEAKKELESLKYNPLFVAGLMLYLGEGDKTTKNYVRLSHSDPKIVKLFVTFLEKACEVPKEKIKAQIITYSDIEEQSNRRFWAFASGIPLEQFSKNTVIQDKRMEDKLRYGVCTVIVSNTYFKVKIMEWLDILPKELMGNEYYENIGLKAAIV